MGSSLKKSEVESKFEDDIAYLVCLAIDSFCAEASKEGNERTGGAICLLSDEGSPLLLKKVGVVSKEDGDRYAKNAFRKCDALFKHNQHLLPSNFALSSFDDRVLSPDAEKPVYGGGITVVDEAGMVLFYVAFSGFPPHWDEALCVAVVEADGSLTDRNRWGIVEISENQHIHKALEIMHGCI